MKFGIKRVEQTKRSVEIYWTKKIKELKKKIKKNPNTDVRRHQTSTPEQYGSATTIYDNKIKSMKKDCYNNIDSETRLESS